MAHVSNHELPTGVRKQIEKQFVHMLFQSDRGSTVLIELLTEVELLMLAKRLAVILMLIDEQSYYRIKQVLGTSVSTSKRIHKFLIGGAYTQVENWCMNKKQRQELLQSIEMLMRAGLPPKAYVIKKRR